MYIYILIMPIITAIIFLLKGRYIGNNGIKYLSRIIINVMNIISIYIYYIIYKNNIRIEVNIYEWIEKVSIIYDKVSITMVLLIITITNIVINYSFWYMKNEPYLIRFISLLYIFSFSMLLLVLSYNYILLFLGWELVGIISFFLINFWFTRIKAIKSGIKALIYNRIGDIFLLYGIINISLSQGNTFLYSFSIKENIFLFIYVGAIIKSAQFVFHGWLGTAMEGPTPVSALLHAATMVTAGIYLLIRSNLYYTNLIFFISIFTLLFAGLASLFINDIKRIIAYSTCGQLAYMFLALSFLSKSYSLYHLFIHGFFKALLFIISGIYIHLYFNEQDLRKYGSLIYFFPYTYILFLIATLSISAFPFTSGFYSKESILLISYTNCLGIIIASIGAIITFIYSFKLIYHLYFKSFNKKFNLFEPQEFHSLIILFFGSLFLGFLFKDFYLGSGYFSLDSDFLHSKFILFILSIIFYILYLSYSRFLYFHKWYRNINSLFNRKLHIESIINIISFSLLKYSYIYRLFEKGILEYIGPLGSYRFISFFNKFPSNFNSNFNIILFIIYGFFYFFFLLFF